MEKLLDYQVEHVKSLKKTIETHKRALDASDTGTGKTYTSIALCIELGLKPLIICPASVIGNWKNVLEYFGADYYGITNYESMHNCRYITPHTQGNKIKCKYIERLKRKLPDDENDYSTKEAEIFSKRKMASFTYKWKNIPNDFILIFDEAHRCKNKKTLNSIILYTAALIDNMKILMLSATIADKPEKFAIAGFVLGLYPTIRNAGNWIAKADSGYEHDMMGVHKFVFNDYGSRMKIKELGLLFPDNKIIADCYDMDNAIEIEQQYKIIEEEVEKLKNKEESSGCALSRILYARMKIEQLKIPTIINQAKKYMEDGASVAIFVNFSMTLQTIADELGTKCVIWGEQTMEDRNKNIEDFNKDRSNIIICNIKSGGVGISLHDTIGDRRRISLISPSDSAQDIIQVLGRIHRANGKTPVQQYIIFCKKTVEEKICENMKNKIQNISSLNDGVVNTYQIDGLTDDKEAVQEVSDLDRTINRITILNMKKQRLEEDLKSVNEELESLEAVMNIICV
ncbi:putative ATP-dependent RNA helicase [Tupanvirus soda lake]|uniref:ATP-dependent RNA helicase n=2 Tax=Tupanvirus TaxID=2094720 RepID=A0AC62AAT0_9VIRU|nr:putative ATP-dependent RNA helicase [Tupanvirus soda lake]QKU34880.1 putative ATP-dependent RNA helicase [Tupanvirus soda lake]